MSVSNLVFYLIKNYKLPIANDLDLVANMHGFPFTRILFAVWTMLPACHHAWHFHMNPPLQQQLLFGIMVTLHSHLFGFLHCARAQRAFKVRGKNCTKVKISSWSPFTIDVGYFKTGCPTNVDHFMCRLCYIKWSKFVGHLISVVQR